MSLLIPIRSLSDTSIDYKKGIHRGNPLGLPGIDHDLKAEHIKFGMLLE